MTKSTNNQKKAILFQTHYWNPKIKDRFLLINQTDSHIDFAITKSI